MPTPFLQGSRSYQSATWTHRCLIFCGDPRMPAKNRGPTVDQTFFNGGIRNAQRGSARRRSGAGRGGGWGLCVAAVAGCGAAGLFRRLGFGARGRAAVAPITVLALASHALGRGTVRCRAGSRRRWGGGMREPGSSGRGWRALGCTRCLRGRGGGASTSGLRCRVSEGRSGSGCPGRRTQGRWAYACRALTM